MATETKQVQGSNVQLQLINDSLFASLTVGELSLAFSSPHHPQLSFPIKVQANSYRYKKATNAYNNMQIWLECDHKITPCYRDLNIKYDLMWCI